MTLRSITVVGSRLRTVMQVNQMGQWSLFFMLTRSWEGSSLGTGVWRDSKAGRGEEKSQWVEEKAQGCPDGSCSAWGGERLGAGWLEAGCPVWLVRVQRKCEHLAKDQTPWEGQSEHANTGSDSFQAHPSLHLWDIPSELLQEADCSGYQIREHGRLHCGSPVCSRGLPANPQWGLVFSSPTLKTIFCTSQPVLKGLSWWLSGKEFLCHSIEWYSVPPSFSPGSP